MNVTKFFRRAACLVFCLCGLLSVAAAQVLAIPPAEYTLDIPSGWQLLAQSDPARIAWLSPDQGTGLKILVFDKPAYPRVEALFTDIKTQLGAEGEGAAYTYLSYPAILADLAFESGSRPVRGYSLFLVGDKFAYALITFSQLERYPAMTDAQLSILDSFGLQAGGRLVPGPLSVFLAQDPEDRPEVHSLKLGEVVFQIETSRSQREVGQLVIDREARLLAAFSEPDIPAWYRFYRMVYRDNYQRLEPVFTALEQGWGEKEKGEKVEALLGWIQGFAYDRTGTVSDFSSPLKTALERKGDCDSRVLLALLLLHRLGIDAVLLVSPVYAHSAVGLSLADYPAEGASFLVKGKAYLYVELTEVVTPGLVPSRMADTANWIGFTLGTP